jgi:segregation and condensation protein B
MDDMAESNAETLESADAVPATDETTAIDPPAVGDEPPPGTDDSEQAAERSTRTPFSEPMRILEAVIFASTEIITPARLKQILPDAPDLRVIRQMVAKLNEKFQKERHPFEIVEVGGGYQFRTVPYFHPWVQQLFKEKSRKRLSIQALESLAIIAYKQPITKAEIESIRGVISDGAMKTLLEKRLITIVGRSEKPGHPLLYGTSPLFISYFGINKIADLPRIEEFEAMARKKMDELTEEELRNIEAAAGEEPENEEMQAAAANELGGQDADGQGGDGRGAPDPAGEATVPE